MKSNLILIACCVANLACVARYLCFGVTWWIVFTAWNAFRALLFAVDKKAWKSDWTGTEAVTILLQAAVTCEALVMLSSTVRSFHWKWRLLTAISIPAAIAAAVAVQFSDDPRAGVRVAILWNQIAGIGLGIVVALAWTVGILLRKVCSPRALFHAGIVSMIWLLSGIGYRAYNTPIGHALADWAPGVLMLAWALTVGRLSIAVEPVDQEALRKNTEKLTRSARISSH